MRANIFSTSGAPRSITYTYDGVSFTTSTLVNFGIIPVCLDATNNTNLEKYPNAVAGASFFCNSAISGTIGINCYPQTGPEAWYIDVTYEGQGGNRGTFYYNYIDQNGIIINDTISFGETKRIISQSNPLTQRSVPAAFQYYISWAMVSRFPGQVLAYPYKDIAGEYTMTLKRADSDGTASIFPSFFYESMSLNNGTYTSTNSGSFSLANAAPTGIGSQLVLGTINPPMEVAGNNGRIPPSCWMTVSPVTKTSFFLTSCLTTQSLWVSMDNYTNYNTGSVLKVSNAELISTSSCWTVNSSSLVISPSFTNVSVSGSFSNCPDCVNATSSFVTGAAVIWDFGNYLSYAGTGNTVYDLSGNNITGSLINGPTWSSTNGGQLSLNSGSQQYISFTTALSASCTTMAIIKAKETNWSNFNNAYSGFPFFEQGNGGLVITPEVPNTKQVIAIVYAGGLAATLCSVTPSTIDTWRTYSFTTNGTNSHILYLDTDVSSSNAVLRPRSDSPTGSAYIGRDPNQAANRGYLNGYVMGYLQYNRQLTKAEIDQNIAVFSSRF